MNIDKVIVAILPMVGGAIAESIELHADKLDVPALLQLDAELAFAAACTKRAIARKADPNRIRFPL